MKNFLYLISGPSGVGKSSLIKGLKTLDQFTKSVISFTTREKRNYESNGIDYNFVNLDTFKKMEKNKEFIRTVKIFENYYGASLEDIYFNLNNGSDVMLDVDCVIARSYRRIFMEKCYSIFIMPPNNTSLRNRLEKRGDYYQSIEERLKKVNSILPYKVEYDYAIVNEDNKLEETIKMAHAIITANRLKIDKQVFSNNLTCQKIEHTICIIKPEAVKAGLINYINNDIKSAGFTISHFKLIKLTKEQADTFYKQFRKRDYYQDFLNYITSGPIVVQIISGSNVVENFLKFKGNSIPENCDPGTLRAKYGLSEKENAIHCSDNEYSAMEEIKFFFNTEELNSLNIHFSLDYTSKTSVSSNLIPYQFELYKQNKLEKTAKKEIETIFENTKSKL